MSQFEKTISNVRTITIKPEEFTLNLMKGGNKKTMKIPTSTKEKSTDFERVHIEEGIYTAELTEVKEVSEGQYGPRSVFLFKIEGTEDVVGHLVYTSNAATKENKLGKTLIALGCEINDKEVDTDSLIGNKVKAWVDDYDYEVEEDGKKTTKTASSISKVKPIAKEE